MILRACTAFFANGRVIRPGDIVVDDDPIVSGREALFEPLSESLVEAATARPGERRTVARVKKAAKKPASKG